MQKKYYIVRRDFANYYQCTGEKIITAANDFEETLDAFEGIKRNSFFANYLLVSVDSDGQTVRELIYDNHPYLLTEYRLEKKKNQKLESKGK